MGFRLWCIRWQMDITLTGDIKIICRVSWNGRAALTGAEGMLWMIAIWKRKRKISKLKRQKLFLTKILFREQNKGIWCFPGWRWADKSWYNRFPQNWYGKIICKDCGMEGNELKLTERGGVPFQMYFRRNRLLLPGRKIVWKKNV